MSHVESLGHRSSVISLAEIPSSRATAIDYSNEPVWDRHISSEAIHDHQVAQADSSENAKTPHLKLFSCILAFFTAGLNDGSLGPLLPYFLEYYALPTSFTAYLYISSFMGWLIIAFTNNHIVAYSGIPGALLLGSLLQVTAQAMRGWVPPFACFAVSFGVVTLGQALQDSSANTIVAGFGKT
jgi:fucose permease